MAGPAIFFGVDCDMGVQLFRPVLKEVIFKDKVRIGARPVQDVYFAVVSAVFKGV